MVAAQPAPKALATISNRVATVLGGLAFASNGFVLAVLSFALLGIQSDWRLNAGAVGVITAAPAVGQIVGALVLGSLVERLSRRHMYLIVVGVIGGFTALAALSPNVPVLCAALLLASTGYSGVAPMVSSLIAEYSPSASRGRMMTWTQVMWACGWTLAAISGRVLLQVLNWRALMAVGGLPLLLIPVALFVLPAIKPRHAEATARPIAPLAGLKLVISPAARRNTLVLWTTWFVMISIFTGPVVWLPTLFRQGGAGDPAGDGVIAAFTMLIGVFIPLWVIDRAGRKPLLAVALGLCALCAVGLALAQAEPLLLAAGALLGATVLAAWPVVLVYGGEIYPAAMRGMGMGWGAAVARCGGLAGPALLGATVGAFGRGPALLIMAAAAAIVAVTFARFGTETAGRDLQTNPVVSMRELLG
ncbi:MAG: MFS transporter [Chloroflexi bacterium]|nr:MFS transporter [Chloroflexota bacterium]